MKLLRGLFFFFPSLLIALSFHRNEELIKTIPAFAGRTIEQPCEDVNLVNRIIVSYQLAEKNHLGDSMWQSFYDQKFYKIHRVFALGDVAEATRILRYPGETDLFYGIDNLAVSLLAPQLTYDGLVGSATVNLDCLVRLGEAIGAIRLHNPESYPAGVLRKWYADEVLQKIENKLGISIHFPNPYPDEVGLITPRGCSSYRAIQAVYQAYRIKELLKDIPNPRVLEIGAGLGRTAYYCKQLGIEDYTIVDIPTTVLASSYFLGRTLGEESIILLGENPENQNTKIKIFTPSEFLSDLSHYDLIVNVDSLTEMDPGTISLYLSKIKDISSVFLSINHEVNTRTVFELLSDSDGVKKIERCPYWMRLGYAEELYIFDE